MKILIVEDEPKTGAYLKQGLIESGFVTDLAVNGIDGRHLALTDTEAPAFDTDMSQEARLVALHPLTDQPVDLQPDADAGRIDAGEAAPWTLHCPHMPHRASGM